MFAQVTSILDTLRPLLSPASTNVLILEGKAKFTEGSLRAMYIGNRTNLQFLQSLFFRSAAITAHAKLAHPVMVPVDIAALPNIDLVLTDVPRALMPLLGIACDAVIPAWIRQEVVFADNTTKWLGSRSIEREASRQQRRHGYTVDITDEHAALVEFFISLYCPYVAARFGPQAVSVSPQLFLRRSRGQKLARIWANNQLVAGMMFKPAREHLRFGWFGANSNPPPPGVSEVLDTFCLKHARALGVPKVVLGHSRPNLNDGVVRYKAKFGASIVPTRFPQTRLGIRVRQWSPEVIECFRQQPLVTQRHGRCYVYRPLMTDSRTHLSVEPLSGH